MIVPTVGRKVLFIPKKDSFEFGFCVYAGKEHSADVVAVHGPRCINVAVFDQNGKPFAKTSVTLVQEGDDPATYEGGDYCKWMPFQVEQAKKHAAA